ncbi:hypothetical protein [Candidatus Mycoplasma mahonii]|uniref:hypothetical protein n=1 Tax=Candidatus Mycoplasma mahonii TaxID=3004105 RepID=UPI0026EEC579|nr:hypothetical protein [Candidatus Mycoplasma mahonii]WKX02295.1 hypothetical protein O3I44_02725 [Candidatus Mycoplasma mahonii]
MKYNNIFKDKIQKILLVSDDRSQVLQTIEELAELIQALLKNINRGKDNIKDIISEMADVIIMLEQLQLIYKIDDESLIKEMKFKINRYLKKKNVNI